MTLLTRKQHCCGCQRRVLHRQVKDPSKQSFVFVGPASILCASDTTISVIEVETATLCAKHRDLNPEQLPSRLFRIIIAA